MYGTKNTNICCTFPYLGGFLSSNWWRNKGAEEPLFRIYSPVVQRFDASIRFEDYLLNLEKICLGLINKTCTTKINKNKQTNK